MRNESTDESIFPEGIEANIDLPTDKKVECLY